MSKREPLARLGSEKGSHRKNEHLDHLTRDVLDAEAAGMSYGQYKALNPRTYVDPEYAPPAPKPDPGMRELVCVHCGGTFLTAKQKSNKQYCSDECRVEASRERNASKVTERVCNWCGKVFGSVSGAKYCCGECCTQAQREMARARRIMKQKGGKKNV